MRNSLPIRVLVACIILLVIPLFIMAFLEFNFAFKENITTAKKHMIQITSDKQGQLVQELHSRVHFLNILSRLLEVEDKLPRLPDKKVDEFLGQLSDIGLVWGMDIFKVTPDQQIINVATTGTFNEGENYTLFFNQQPIFDKPYVSYLAYDRRSAHEKILIATLLIKSKEDGNPIAVLALSFPMNDNLTRILKPLETPFEVDFALLNTNHIIFAASEKQLELNHFVPLSKEELEQIEASKIFDDLSIPKGHIPIKKLPENPGFFEFDLHGKTQIAYEQAFENSQRSLVTYSEKKLAFASSTQKYLIISAIYTAILLIGSLIVWWLTFRMARPFKHLSHVMNAVKNNNLNARYKPDAFGFEINYLGEIFNQMIRSLLEQMRKAEEERVQREILAQELKIGHDIQLQLLPQKMPEYPDVEIAELFIPAKEVGGDFYDVFINQKNQDKNLVLAIADTSGKGVSACFYSLGVRSLLRGFGKEIPDFKQFILLTNNNFFDDTGDTGMFITMFIGSYEYKTRRFSYYSCGHNPAILRRKNGEIEILKSDGIAMGLMKMDSIKEQSTVLEKGDIILFYTDGVTEAHNIEKKLFGFKRLADFVQHKDWKSADQLVHELIEEIHVFTNPAPQHDDITLLAMRVF